MLLDSYVSSCNALASEIPFFRDTGNYDYLSCIPLHQRSYNDPTCA